MVFKLLCAAFSIAILIWPCLVLGVDQTRDPGLVAKLKTAATANDKRTLLPNDSDWLYDFTKQDYYTFAPGGVINANAATFPATVGNGMTMALLNLGPCSMLPPHYHPRASNYVVAIHGTTATYMIPENGDGVVKQTLTPGKMTIFPQGSLHTMMNIGCTNAQLVAALNNEDQGTLNLGYGLQNLPGDLVNAAMGYQNVSTSDTLAKIWPIGTGSNYGPKECLAKCAALNATGAQQPTCGPPSPSALSQSGGAGGYGAGSSETTDSYLYNFDNSPDGV
ncbi:RmlC-like cupin domain-containing protein [Delphinella strobiligena]|nr:RmlC-like cupin domain-containing protein [Delphinella strobiligena]